MNHQKSRIESSVYVSTTHHSRSDRFEPLLQNLQLEIYNHHHSTIRQHPQRENPIIIRKLRLHTPQLLGGEIYQQCLAQRREYPAGENHPIETKGFLAFGVEFGDCEEGGCAEILFKGSEEDDGKGGEEGVEEGHAPGFVKGSRGEAGVVLVEELGHIEDDLFPEGIISVTLTWK